MGVLWLVQTPAILNWKKLSILKETDFTLNFEKIAFMKSVIPTFNLPLLSLMVLFVFGCKQENKTETSAQIERDQKLFNRYLPLLHYEQHILPRVRQSTCPKNKFVRAGMVWPCVFPTEQSGSI